ncbi:MAG: hypothetical protein Q4G27_01095 [Flavobacteriaceae bacterium]|nr:hypothetical protein [Flavobacteriaceae bacterium]
MRKLENYTEEEWEVVSSLPHLVGLAMSGIAASGIVGTTKEMMAHSKAWKAAKEKYPDNELIQAMMPNMESIESAMSDAKEKREAILDKMKSNDVRDGEGLAAIVMEDAARAIDILETKEEPHVVEEFKTWLADIASDVAHAGTEGDFFGFGGTQYSDKEKKLFDNLNEAMKS